MSVPRIVRGSATRAQACVVDPTVNVNSFSASIVDPNTIEATWVSLGTDAPSRLVLTDDDSSLSGVSGGALLSDQFDQADLDGPMNFGDHCFVELQIQDSWGNWVDIASATVANV